MPIEEAVPHLDHNYFMLNVIFEILVLYLLLGFGVFSIKFGRLAVGQGMIFGFLEKYEDDFWAKPFFGCEYCMASIWGASLYLAASLYKGWLTFDVITLIGFCICLSGFIKYLDEQKQRVNWHVNEETEEETEGYAKDDLSEYD